MKIEECADTDQIFTHEVDGKVRHFNATKMYDWAVANPENVDKVLFPLDAAHVEFIKNNAGVEEAKIDRLAYPWLGMPIVAIEFEPGFILIVDGNHRFVKLFNDGEKQIKAFVFQMGTWEPFLLEGCDGIGLSDLERIDKNAV